MVVQLERVSLMIWQCLTIGHHSFTISGHHAISVALGHFIGSLHKDTGKSCDHLVAVSIADESKKDKFVGQDLGCIASAKWTRNLVRDKTKVLLIIYHQET